MKQKLFQFAILYHEKIYHEGNREEIKSKTIVPIGTILAQDDKVAILQIAKQIPDEYSEKLQDIEILLRPF